jgi:hypothetical protein
MSMRPRYALAAGLLLLLPPAEAHERFITRHEADENWCPARCCLDGPETIQSACW